MGEGNATAEALARSLSEEIRLALPQLLADARLPGADVGDLLNACLQRFLVWPFRVNPGKVFDASGVETATFDTLIYTSPNDLTRVPADFVACAIHVDDVLGLKGLRASYAKIAQAKSLTKKPPAKVTSGVPVADDTMGIILAVDSVIPLEDLAQELELLNKNHPHDHWVDMVVVLKRGVIHYVAQFPHQAPGAFLPPARGIVAGAPMYIHIFAKGHAEFSLSTMCAILFSYLCFFSPGTVFANLKELIESTPKTGLTIAPYQYNLKGHLVPVPSELKFNRFLVFPLGFRAEDGAGRVLSKVSYLPWQDGGVIRVSGEMPLEVFLVFAGPAAKGAQKVPVPGGQLTSVLPISPALFIEMANRMARQSNITIIPDEPPKWVAQKKANAGTGEPFYARLFLGILRLRDQSITDAGQRDQFDKAFEGVIAGLESMKDACAAIAESYQSHSQRVARGEVARIIQHRNIELDETIDKELRKQVETVISVAGRVFKDRMQDVLRSVKVDVGFLYKQQKAFANGVSKMRQSDPGLADYLEQTQTKWSERLTSCRIALEHSNWVLPKIEYIIESGVVKTVEPVVDGQPMTEFVAHVFDRVCCFVEELCAHAFQRHIAAGLSITEIPLVERKVECVERFQMALVGGGLPIWSITYHDSKFQDT
jgi:hypothetical protein